MVGNRACPKQKKLEDVLTEEQVDSIISKVLNNGGEWCLISSEVKPAADGLSGFLGDHLRVTLNVASGGNSQSILLFIKRLPLENQPKAEFIEENNFFKREAVVCQLLDELQSDDDPQPWCIKSLIANNSMIVMPDVRPLGYSTRSSLQTLDLPHLLRTAASVARFHAATANYETKQYLRSNKPWSFSKEHAVILIDPSFKDWVRACAKLAANILKVLSKKYQDLLDLEQKLTNKFIEACDSLKEYEDTPSVLLHKDLWISNIMFRYENDEPVNALLIDYQCLRYGPPAFDLTVLLYCTTSKFLREQHEITIFKHYYSVFSENIEEATKQKLVKLGYDEKEFLQWCEKARLFGAMQACVLLPYVLMDPITAQKLYDNPQTFKDIMWADRTKPVVEYCQRNLVYQQRLIEVLEEFVERYLCG